MADDGNHHAKRTDDDPLMAELEQVHSDFALAVELQEQERAFTLLSSSESDDDENEISSSDDSENDDRYEQLFGTEVQFRAEFEFLEALEAEEDNSDEEMEEDDMNSELEEDDIDPDELSYEEMIALGEIVGKENRGLSADEISSSLHPSTYCQLVDCKNLIDKCVICQVEYEEREALVALSCDHQYHLDCISKWLRIRKICPICSAEVSSPKICTSTTV